MTFKEKQFFVINFCLCAIARTAILFFSYKQLSKYFFPGSPLSRGRRFGSRRKMVACTLLSKKQLQKALFLRRSIALAARHTPWDSSCLTQALVTKFWCERYHIPYLFFIGLPKNANRRPLSKEAHTWITAGPLYMSGGNGFQTHQVILTYSNRL